MSQAMQTFIPLELVRRGEELLTSSGTPAFDATLINGLARAFYWKDLMDSGVVRSASDVARREGVHVSVITELLRMTLLAPDIIQRFLAGRQPRRLTLMWFQRKRLPVDWEEQRQLMASFE